MILDMRPYMAADLAGVFTYDFTDTFTYNSTVYTGIFRDRTIEEIDEMGGPVSINILEIHVLTTALASIPNGALLTAKGDSKIVQRSELSEDGNELIIYCRYA